MKILHGFYEGITAQKVPVIPAEISAGHKYGSVGIESEDSSNKDTVCDKIGFSGEHCLGYGSAGIAAADKNIVSVAHQTGGDGGDVSLVRTEIQDLIFDHGTRKKHGIRIFGGNDSAAIDSLDIPLLLQQIKVFSDGHFRDIKSGTQIFHKYLPLI